MPVFLYLFVTGRENAAVILYGIAAWTDFLDGYIARRTGTVTELGKLLDPVSDRIFIVALVVMLLVRGTLPWWLGAAVIARDLVVLSVFPALERRKVERIPVNRTGKLATACLLFGLTWLALSETDFAVARFGDEVGLTFVAAGTVLYWAAGGMYAREALIRYRGLDPGKTVP
ncbi:MAG: CDP-alcohol phosphatidyltransferase family protein [Actinomycetota bacterium]|nr:CDP-alcohol phosphatidyltransferase family protein [Actinomycetota bacterium]